MPSRLSNRSIKYVWLCLPGIFGIFLTGSWFVSVAPQMQNASLTETQWREDLSNQKARAEFLEKNQIHSDYDQLIFQGVITGQSDLKDILLAWTKDPANDIYQAGKTIRLLDQYQNCIGYLIAPKGLYLDSDNPGLCSTENAGVDNALKSAKTI